VVDGLPWHEVPQYLKEARKRRARRQQELVLIQRADAALIRRYVNDLAEDAGDKAQQDPRIEEAERLETWAAALPSEKAQTALMRAKYLRTAVKYNLDA